LVLKSTINALRKSRELMSVKLKKKPKELKKIFKKKSSKDTA
jgi:hypothetical protein